MGETQEGVVCLDQDVTMWSCPKSRDHALDIPRMGAESLSNTVLWCCDCLSYYCYHDLVRLDGDKK